jgi:hypothetical protein
MFRASAASASLRTTKKTQFNHLGRSLIKRLQTGQALVNRQQSFIEFPVPPLDSNGCRCT